jgi:hypothetical protein
MAGLAVSLVLLAVGPEAEIEVLVDRLVEQRDGPLLAEGIIEALRDEHGLDRPGPVPGRWLPTLVLRLSWSPGRYEVILCASWPLG